PLDVTGLATERSHVAEPPERLLTRVRRRQTGRLQIHCTQFHVQPQRLVHLVLDTLGAHQRTQLPVSIRYPAHEQLCRLRGQDFADDRGELLPRCRFCTQLSPTLRRERVVLRAAVVLRHAPLRL